MTRYAAHAGTRVTTQSQPIPGAGQVPNSAGGFAWAVDHWTRLRRFLILGNEGGSYYAGERALTLQASAALAQCAAEDAARTVRTIVEISQGGRAPKNDPAVFALAQLAGSHPQAALPALGDVCRTGTHLFQFVESALAFRGWGRALRRALGTWYAAQTPRDLAYQVTKYQSRGGWSHRDVLRLAHPKLENEALSAVCRWAVGKDVAEQSLPEPIQAFEQAKRATTEEEIVRVVRDHRLVRECVPTHWLNSPAVWDALLADMPVTAVLRNLGKLSVVGLLKPMSPASAHVARLLSDRAKLKAARVHPLAVLVAQRTYAQGRGEKGKLTWTSVPQVVEALDDAFYAAFDSVEPTGKRWLLALDVSGSMGAGRVAGSSITPREASACLALVTARVEPEHAFVAFASGDRPSMHAGYGTGIVPLAISARQRLDDVVRATSALPFGGTDCALPMIYALEQKIPVDVFVVLTDSETWAGSIHPSQALRQYRQKMGIPAKLIVVGMVANNFTIADPNDAGMLDVVGFDTTCPQVMAEFATGG